MSASASKVRDARSSAHREYSFMKNRRSVSADTRARGSYVPERKRASSEERKSGNSLFSANRWSGARKSSINLVDTKRKDPRPLTDKAYQKRKIAQLVEFLEAANFKYPIKASKLQSPSKKDVENIFEFLYQYFDPRYEVHKIEEEALKIIKNLGYPFTINKSAFVYVARTNWPSLLGILIWLMDLNKFAMKIDISTAFETAGGGENVHAHPIFLRYILQCYYSGIDQAEEEIVIFTEIFKKLMPEDLEELPAQHEEKRKLLNAAENELNEMKRLAEQKEQLDVNIEKYEDYIVKMKSHHQKKNEWCDQLMEQLKRKESELKDLQDAVAGKQDAYDAQGFDGKKQMNYFESQKKDLIEKLEKKHSVVKKIQDKFWDAEIQYNKNLDKTNAASESVSELYNSVIEEAKGILQPLESVKIPQVQKLCSTYHLDFPAWEVPPRSSQADSKLTLENTLESMRNKIRSTNDIFKRVSASQSEKLSDIQMKKSELSMKLKLLSVQESQKENDLSSKGKQAIDEIASLDVQHDKMLKAVKTLQTERLKLERTSKEMADELAVLKALRQQKEKELKEYLAEQGSFFEYLSSTEQEVAETCQEYGNEILLKFEEVQTL